MNEFMIEQQYLREERDRDSLPYYGDSESNMIEKMIKDAKEAMSGDLDEDEDEDDYQFEEYDPYELGNYHDFREDLPDTDLFDNGCFMY